MYYNCKKNQKATNESKLYLMTVDVEQTGHVDADGLLPAHAVPAAGAGLADHGVDPVDPADTVAGVAGVHQTVGGPLEHHGGLHLVEAQVAQLGLGPVTVEHRNIVLS